MRKWFVKAKMYWDRIFLSDRQWKMQYCPQLYRHLFGVLIDERFPSRKTRMKEQNKSSNKKD